MRCKFCGYPRLSVIKVWEDENKKTWVKYGCFMCGKKFNVPREEKAPLSKYARR